MTALADPPVICPVVAGPCQVWVDTGSARALEFLGWSVNGVTIEQTTFQGEIHSDENGGDQGPPSDYQLFGHQHRISMELSKFQAAVLNKLDGRYNPNVTGADVGMLLSCSQATFRLLLKAPNFVRNYPTTIIPDPIELGPVGSNASRARITFIARAALDGTLWNETTTTP